MKLKLKYKKKVLAITTFTMMIGMVIFSVITPDNSSVSETGKLNSSEEEMLDKKDDSQMKEETQAVADGQEMVIIRSKI